jgi:hypothetical protein
VKRKASQSGAEGWGKKAGFTHHFRQRFLFMAAMTTTEGGKRRTLRMQAYRIVADCGRFGNLPVPSKGGTAWRCSSASGYRSVVVIPLRGSSPRKFLHSDDHIPDRLLFVVVKGELTPIKNNQKKEQKMKNTNKKTILGAFPSVFGLMALLICTFLATSATAGDQSPQNRGRRLFGFFDSQVTLTNCQGVVIRTFESYQLFNQGGTLTSTDNQPSASARPGIGTWQCLGGGSYSAPFQIFTFNTDGTWSGHAKVNRDDLQLAADGNSYTSAGSVEFFDTNGNLIATVCGSEIATRVVN